MAQTVGMVPGTVTLNLCNCHIYDNHVELLKDNLMKWRKEQFDLPKLILEPEADVFNFRYEMAKLDNYQHGDKVTFPIAV
jgi:thymidylate synthase